MHGSACIIWWLSGLLGNLISTYITQFMGYVISRIHYGLKVVCYFWYFTVSHYHHYSRLMAGTEHIHVWRVSFGGVSDILLVLSITFYFHYNIWVVCVQLAHLRISDWKDIAKVHVIIIIKSEVSTFPIVFIFFRGCVPEMFATSYSVTDCIYIPGKPGICFH